MEVFGVGTAAVVSPIELIDIQGRSYQPDVSSDAVLFRLKKDLQAIRSGKNKDVYHWNHIIRINGDHGQTTN